MLENVRHDFARKMNKYEWNTHHIEAPALVQLKKRKMLARYAKRWRKKNMNNMVFMKCKTHPSEKRKSVETM